jgi:hypothetical protein
MNAVSIILYIAAAFAGFFILTRILVRTLKVVLLLALALFILSWVRFSHTPLCASSVQKKLPQWAAPICNDTGPFRKKP